LHGQQDHDFTASPRFLPRGYTLGSPLACSGLSLLPTSRAFFQNDSCEKKNKFDDLEEEC